MENNHTDDVLRTMKTIAYFSMEIGADPAIPTYGGGLGVLAGDCLRAAADLGQPLVGMTLLYRKGYFRQHLDAEGNQSESPSEWRPEEVLEPMAPRIVVTIEGRPVSVRAWKSRIRGIKGDEVPVYFLDTALPENDPRDRVITDLLYVSNDHMRLIQETVLGYGGVTMLKALGHPIVKLYHMNEGHSALLTLALLEEQTNGRGILSATDEDRDAVRDRCVFTTHTPVPAGHDQFPRHLVEQILGRERAEAVEANVLGSNGVLNMTKLALSFSRHINGVAMRHGEISQTMFPHYPVSSITNGVHAATWTSDPFQRLFDRQIPQWRYDNLYLRHAISIPKEEIREAHCEAKQDLLAEVERRTQIRLDPDVMTIGFARRAAAYKRANLVFSDIERLRRIARTSGGLQVVFGGKAHPADVPGKQVIRKVFEAAKALGPDLRVIYLEEYDMALARIICAGVDLWLNTPQKPQEASGTSGMKAALNGVPSLSVLDGWWAEGHIEGVTGWSIGNYAEGESASAEAQSLYDKLEKVILPLYYQWNDDFTRIMRSTIALNGSFFNAQRMMYQYLKNAYYGT